MTKRSSGADGDQPKKRTRRETGSSSSSSNDSQSSWENVNLLPSSEEHSSTDISSDESDNVIAGPSSYPCHHCPSRYQTQQELTLHIQTIHPQKSPNKKCRFCSFTSPDYYEVLRHECVQHSQCQEREEGERGKKGRKRAHEKVILQSKQKKIKLNNTTDKKNLTYKIKTGSQETSSLQKRLTRKYFPIQLSQRNPSSDAGDLLPIVCIGDALEAFRSIVRQHVRKYFNQFGALLYRLRLTCRMEKALRTDSPQDEGVFSFMSYSEPLEEMMHYNSMYNQQSEKIWEEFANFVTNGSGWVLKNVEGLFVEITSWRSFSGGASKDTNSISQLKMGKIDVPPQIRNSKSVINIQTDDDCFKYAVTCALHHSEVSSRGLKTNIKSSYNNFLPNTNWTGLQFPLKVSEKNFKTFEENNPELALNIMCVKVSKKKNKKREKVVKRKAIHIHTYRTSPHTRERYNIYLCLLYHPPTRQAHFTAITKLQSFLANASKVIPKDNKVITCFRCRTRFCGLNHQRNYNAHFSFCGERTFSTHFTKSATWKNSAGEDDKQKSVCQNCFSTYEGGTKEKRDEYLLHHQKFCLENDAAYVKMPEDPALTFNNFFKQREAPFVIYADTESVLVNDSLKKRIDEKITKIKARHTNQPEEPEVNLRLDIFEDDEEDEETLEDDADGRDYNVEIDNTDLPTTPNELPKTEHNHEISGFCLKVVTLPHLQDYFPDTIRHTGIDSGFVFFQKLAKIREDINDIWSREGHKIMENLSDQQKMKNELTKECHICKNEIISTTNPEEYKKEYDSMVEDRTLSFKRKKLIHRGPKVLDHDHWFVLKTSKYSSLLTFRTGKFVGVAHQLCNIEYYDRKTVPLFFHGGSNYDFHHILRYLPSFEEQFPNIDVIGKSAEKFTTFSLKARGLPTIAFKDSANFLQASLDQLTQNLKHLGTNIGSQEDAFPHTFNHFNNNMKPAKNLPDSAFQMLLKKGHFPYEWFTSFNKFKAKKLPRRKAFHNSLSQSDLDLDSYKHAQKMYSVFKCSNFEQYHDLYLELDTLLLCDVMERFRRSTREEYGLDPVHYITLPSLTWDAGLKFTKVKLDLITDYDMTLFLDRGMYGGVSSVGHPFARSGPDDTIVYMDATNLYGFAMSQYLPTGRFRWETNPGKFTEEFVRNLGLKDKRGYFLEVDLDYPESLHDLHNEFPLAPENLKVKPEYLSKHQLHNQKKFGVKPGGKKLVCNLFNKRNYVLHYWNLKQYIRLGLKLRKVHRVLSFDQSPWLKPYIDKNTTLRRMAVDPFNKARIKLMNNSFYGKTVEQQRNYRDYRFIYGYKKYDRLKNLATFRHGTVYGEDWALVELKKTTIKLNKPRYIGITVLCLAKHHMFQFHYDHILPTFNPNPKINNNVKLLMTDTDSLCYHIKKPAATVYPTLKKLDWIDFSNYKTGRYKDYHCDRKYLVPGYFKDETKGVHINEFIGLGPKVYSLKTEDDKEEITLKGLHLNYTSKFIRHQMFADALSPDYIDKKAHFRTIESKDQQIKTVNKTHATLIPVNEKKFMDNQNNIYSLGHYKIPILCC